MFWLFKKKNNKLPHKVEVALQDYRTLRLEGCLIIPCKKCRHLIKLNDHRYTCKRIQLMRVLWPDYKQEVYKIDDELRKR